MEYLRQRRETLKEGWATGFNPDMSVDQAAINCAAGQYAAQVLNDILNIDHVELRNEE